MTTQEPVPQETDAPPQPQPVVGSLAERVRGAVIFGFLVIAGIYFGGHLFGLLLVAAGAIGAFEWTRMVTKDRANAPKSLPLAASAVGGLAALSGVMTHRPMLAVVYLLALCFLLYAFNKSQNGPSLRLTVYGLVYMTLSLSVIAFLRDGTSAAGLYHVATLFLIVWASDISAYFTGRAIGGPKLAPAISPKKTWAGFIGSSVGAGLAAAGLACPWLVGQVGMEAHTIGGMGSTGYFILGFVLAMAGQAGDLLVSVFKRHFNVKDTGAIIPGHGGILDRIDALLLVALLFGPIKILLG